MNIHREIQDIEKMEMRLAEKKEYLLEQEQRLRDADERLDNMFKNSGYAAPKELIDALIFKFKVRVTPMGRLVKRRKRTKITIELRDSIARDLSSGMSMNAASKKYAVSYAVIVKVSKGQYSHLRK